MSQFTRRKFIVTAGAAAAGSMLLNACANDGAGNPAGSPSGSASSSTVGGLETTKARLGFIALTDSSPLIIALEKGLFAKHGMTEVEIVKQASWPVTRDNLEIGSQGGGIDGAHILSFLT
jgi:nitrate/nitrite transport system substrate-binding protein